VTGQSGAVLQADGGVPGVIREFVREALRSGRADSVLVPVRVPSGESFAWILTDDDSVVAGSTPVAPVMPVQGARALRSLSRKGFGKGKVLAVMRPCEIRAGIELAKLGQVHRENLLLASFDCPGAIPLRDYLSDPEGGDRLFGGMLETWEQGGNVKPVCETCIEFSRVGSDIHLCHLGLPGGRVVALSAGAGGDGLLGDTAGDVGGELSAWQEEIQAIHASRSKAREAAAAGTLESVRGFEGMQAVFADCIGCHNCQSACPICYCRLCYFDSETAEGAPGAIVETAERRGGISLPPDRIMFHTGRMTHMSLSCVSCGQCSDVCPVEIPVAEVFGSVADRTQKAFDYHAGDESDDALPLRQFRKSELQGISEMVKDAEQAVHGDG